MTRFLAGILAVVTAAALTCIAAPGAGATADGLRHCEVSDGRQPETATAEEVGWIRPR
ncbi:hypothetical protein ACFXPR_02095 [Nocardia tengchongensis]|uniref:hypothetical protein n=1 Tax=Nocardia tengchongensis TaxID=2055889 RepID=UPI0036CE6DB8